MTLASAPTRTLPLSLCIGWGFGTLGIAIIFNSVNLLILRYMTDWLGIAAATAGLLIALSKAYDAVLDPIIGNVSDRTRSSMGRRRPYLLAGAFMCGLALPALFSAPAIDDMTSRTIYIGVMLILFATAYATFNVPYLAMPAEMTDDYHERSYLISFRVTAIGIGQVLGGFLGPYLIVTGGGGMAGHNLLGWVLGGLTFTACLLCFLMTGSARRIERDEGERPTYWSQLKLAWENKPFVWLMSAKLTQLMSMAVTQSVIAYFTTRVLKAGDTILGLIMVVTTVGLFVSIPIWVRLGRKIGKKNAYILATVVFGLATATWWFSAEGEAPLVFYLRAFVQGFGSAGMMLMGASMLPDTMEYDTRRTGMRREGVFSGIYTMMEKVAFAIGVSLTGAFLGAMGYIESRAGVATEQPDSAIQAIYICAAILPAAGMLISAIFIAFYDLKEDKLKTATMAAE
ncbi:MAG: MFS transporter [Alphaproteobacteria bacterium]|nr:MFS transporter [Alphaproteobacteria bacterium]